MQGELGQGNWEEALADQGVQEEANDTPPVFSEHPLCAKTCKPIVLLLYMHAPGESVTLR